MLLRNFWQWRDAKQEFVKLDEMVEKSRLTLLKRALLLIYPEKARQVFDFIEKRLGSSFYYRDASILIQKELKQKYELTPVQLITFGFLCPDHEFKSRLTLFMYT